MSERRSSSQRGELYKSSQYAGESTGGEGKTLPQRRYDILVNLPTISASVTESRHHQSNRSSTRSPSRRGPNRHSTNMMDSLFLSAVSTAPHHHQHFNDAPLFRGRQQQQQTNQRHGASDNQANTSSFLTRRLTLVGMNAPPLVDTTGNLETIHQKTSKATSPPASSIPRQPIKRKELVSLANLNGLPKANDQSMRSTPLPESDEKATHPPAASALASLSTVPAVPFIGPAIQKELVLLANLDGLPKDYEQSIHLTPLPESNECTTHSPAASALASATTVPYTGLAIQTRQWRLVPTGKMPNCQVRSTKNTKRELTTSRSLPLMQSLLSTDAVSIQTTTRTLRSNTKTMSPTLDGNKDHDNNTHDSDHPLYKKKGLHRIQQGVHSKDKTRGLAIPPELLHQVKLACTANHKGQGCAHELFYKDEQAKLTTNTHSISAMVPEDHAKLASTATSKRQAEAGIHQDGPAKRLRSSHTPTITPTVTATHKLKVRRPIKDLTKTKSWLTKKGKEMQKKKQTQSSLQNWNKRLEELVQYKQEHGHCNVTREYAPNPTLGNWVANQRRKHSGTQRPPFSEEEYDKLDSIGIDWKPYDTAWDKYFQQLFTYLKKTKLPPASRSELGNWIRHQRRRLQGKRGKQLPQKRIDKLRTLPLQIFGFPPVHKAPGAAGLV